MITDSQAAQYLVKQYAGDASAFDLLDPGLVDSIWWASVRIDGITYIFLRGSVTFRDWVRDAMAFANPFTHDALGPCHPGFYLGMHELWAELKRKTQGPYVLVGHSLGAGRGYILAGIMVLDGHPPLRQIYFGSPKPGFQKLASIVHGVVPATSYRNGDTAHHDLITDSPATLPPEEFVHPDPLSVVTAAPSPDLVKELGVFAWHHMGLYAAAVAGVSA